MNIKAEIATFGQSSHNCMMYIFEVKFIYSEKATKFCKISTVDLTVTTLGQIYGGDFAKICGLFRIYELYEIQFSLHTEIKKLPEAILKYEQKISIISKKLIVSKMHFNVGFP